MLFDKSEQSGELMALPIVVQFSCDEFHVVVQSEDAADEQEGLRHVDQQTVRHVVDHHHLVSHECNAAHNQQHCTSVLRDDKALFHISLHQHVRSGSATQHTNQHIDCPSGYLKPKIYLLVHSLIMFNV